MKRALGNGATSAKVAAPELRASPFRGLIARLDGV
jgi:hypothetical protein